MEKKKYASLIKLVFFFLVLFIFAYPLLYYGIVHREDIINISFDLKYQNPNLFDISRYFVNFIGAGDSFPTTTQALLYHPLNFVFINPKPFLYFIFIFFHFFVQIYFFSKTLKLLKIKYNYFSLVFLTIFLIPNINYLFADDWIGIFAAYSFYFPIIYYCLKLSKKKQNLSFIQLSFWFSFSFINFHVGYVALILFFLSFYFILNYKILNFIIKKKLFYISIFLILVICSEKIFYLLTSVVELLNFSDSEIIRNNLPGYILDIYVLAPISFMIDNTWPDSRFPYSGLFVILSFYHALKIFFKKETKNFYFLNVIFLIFLILSLSSKFHLIFPIISGTFLFRDLVNIIGLILFFSYIENFNLKKKIIFICNLILIVLFSIVVVTNNFKNNELARANYLVNDSKDLSNSVFSIEEIKKNELFFNKTYLSPNFLEDLGKQKLKNYKIYHSYDLIDFNFSPFYYESKAVGNSYKIQNSKMLNQRLSSNFDEINSEIFLSFFNIKYLLIYDYELIHLKNKKNFEEIKKIKVNNKYLILLKRFNHNKLPIILTNDLNKVNCKNFQDFVECINKYENYFKLQKVNFQLIDDNKFVFHLNDLKNSFTDYSFFLPFLYDDNWRTVPKNLISNLDKRVLVINLNKINSESVELFYEDYIRYYLNIISVLGLIFLLIVIIKIKFFKTKI